MKNVKISKPTEPSIEVHVKYCDTFLSKFVGLMFVKELDLDRGIILVDHEESRINSSIHMLFMNFDILVLWLDKNLVVVDKVLAKKWKPAYLPKLPAQYVLELHPTKFSEFSIGDQLIILN